MELHNDGTYVEEITDYVLMMKIDEQNIQGGNSLLLHLDDWEHLDLFFRHPLARRPMRFAAPPSKNVSKDVFHPVFDVDHQGHGGSSLWGFTILLFVFLRIDAAREK